MAMKQIVQRSLPRAIAPAAAATATSQGRVAPTVAVPSPEQKAGNYPTRPGTFITQGSAIVQTLYQATQGWARVKLRLETAGPVAVSTSQQFLPITSGKGMLLPTGDWAVIELAQGNNLFISAPNVNRIAYVIEPIPWAEQILGGIVRGFTGVVQAVGPLGGLASAIQNLTMNVQQLAAKFRK